jgi:hypothetical protein
MMKGSKLRHEVKNIQSFINVGWPELTTIASRVLDNSTRRRAQSVSTQKPSEHGFDES